MKSDTAVQWWAFLGCALLLQMSCHGTPHPVETKDQAMNKDAGQVQDETVEIVVKDAHGAVVGRMHKKGGVLHGVCDWYDLKGHLVAQGTFRDGSPYSGKFLSFSSYFGPHNLANAYDLSYYVKDWITAFEMGFLSASPDYGLLLECYADGNKVPCAQ